MGFRNAFAREVRIVQDWEVLGILRETEASFLGREPGERSVSHLLSAWIFCSEHNQDEVICPLY